MDKGLTGSLTTRNLGSPFLEKRRNKGRLDEGSLLQPVTNEAGSNQNHMLIFESTSFRAAIEIVARLISHIKTPHIQSTPQKASNVA